MIEQQYLLIGAAFVVFILLGIAIRSALQPRRDNVYAPHRRPLVAPPGVTYFVEVVESTGGGDFAIVMMLLWNFGMFFAFLLGTRSAIQEAAVSAVSAHWTERAD
jgi:hypothetical protein